MSESHCLKQFGDRLADSATLNERQWQQQIREMTLRPGLIVDLGGGSPYQGYIKPHSLGPSTEYLCLDLRFSARPNIVGDGAHVPLASESVSGILCNAVLEHVPDPQAVVSEIRRLLEPGGQALVGVPFIYPYHDQIDFYRFSDSALERMFRDFSSIELIPVGDYFFVSLLFLTGFNFRLARLLSPILHLPRFALRGVMELSQIIMQSSHQGRDYLRSLERSPVGWYVRVIK